MMYYLTIKKDDLDVAARTCAGEARGEKERIDAMKAVAHVIFNRAKRGGWWGDTVSEVCHKAQQFSCWNENDPNHKVISELSVSDSIYTEAVTAVALAYVDDEDPTNGATHYYATFIKEPWWAKNMEEVAEFGGHKFFKS